MPPKRNSMGNKKSVTLPETWCPLGRFEYFGRGTAVGNIKLIFQEPQEIIPKKLNN